MATFLLDSWSRLLPGVWTTVLITAATVPLFLVVGLVVALMRLNGPPPLRKAGDAYVAIVRGTPLLLQLFWIFFALPFVGLTLDPIIAGIVGMALSFGAYASEIFRAGIQSIPTQQIEAATVLGMGRWTSLRRVVLPQAVLLMLPALGNNVIELIKATSLLSIITVGDIVLQAQRILIQTYNPAGVWLLVAAWYFVLCYPTSLLVGWLDARMRRRTFGLMTTASES